MLHALQIKASGERVRNLVVLRIREYDRNIARVESALTAGREEAARAESDVGSRVNAAQERVRRMPMGIAGGVPFGGNYESIENALAVMQYQRSQIQWLHDSFDPSGTYDLNGNDLVALGIEVIGGIGLAGMYRGFDPLENL